MSIMWKKVVSAIRVETGSESDAQPVTSCSCLSNWLLCICWNSSQLSNLTMYLPNYRPEAIGLPRHGENTGRITWEFREIIASIIENIHV